MNKQVRISGLLLIATGIVHNVVGVIMGFDALVAIVRSGVFNAIDVNFHRMAIFWFLFSGFGIMACGDLLLERETMPRRFAWALLIVGVVGAFMMPISGFWLVIPQAIYMLRVSQQERSGAGLSQARA